jgi:RND family efflux transporter MFP subunit
MHGWPEGLPCSSLLPPGNLVLPDEPSTEAPSMSIEYSSAESEAAKVSTSFAPGTGRKLKMSAMATAIVLLCAFLIVHFIKASGETQLRDVSKTDASRRHPVNVIIARGPGTTRPMTLPGETAAWYESTLYARVTGYVSKWYVDMGDHVTQGQILASIDTPELDADLSAARAELTAAQAQVRVRAAEAEFAKSTNERWRDSPKGVVSEQERESKRADHDSAVARLNAANAQVALDKARVDRFMALTQFKQVVAPFDGTVTERRVDIGNLVTAGSSSNTLLYRISQEKPIRVFVDVPQSAAGELMKKGVPVQITASSIAGRIFEGKVARTANAINPQARTLRVEVDIENADQALVSGMYVDVAFALQSTNLVQVPAAALMFRASGPQVAVVDSDGRLSLHKVTIARDDGNMVELQSGISSGDKVALNLSSQISDGELVSVIESTNGQPAPASKAR